MTKQTSVRNGQDAQAIKDEWSILRRVFSMRQYPMSVVTKGEAPDFIINSGSVDTFGVEVTKFYIDKENSGAYFNNKKYRNSIFSDARTIKPKHKKILLTASLTVSGETVMNVIFRQSPSLEQRLDRLHLL